MLAERILFLSTSSSEAHASRDQFFTPQPLRAVEVLFLPMVSGWVGGWSGGQAGRLQEKFVQPVSQKL